MDAETQLGLILVFGVVGFVVILLVVPRLTLNKKKYALQRGGAKRLEIKWSSDKQKIVVTLDTKQIGILEFTTDEEKSRGKTVTLPDGSILNIKLGLDAEASGIKGLTFAPDVTLNGKPVPGSINDPGYKLDVAVKNFYWGGVINIISGVFVLSAPDLAWYYIFIVIPTGIIAFWVGYNLKRLSRTALSVGIGLAVFSGVTFLIVFLVTLSVNTGEGICGDLFDLVDTYLFIDGLNKGFKAIDYLENERKEMTN